MQALPHENTRTPTNKTLGSYFYQPELHIVDGEDLIYITRLKCLKNLALLVERRL